MAMEKEKCFHFKYYSKIYSIEKPKTFQFYIMSLIKPNKFVIRLFKNKCKMK